MIQWNWCYEEVTLYRKGEKEQIFGQKQHSESIHYMCESIHYMCESIQTTKRQVW